jgi:HSF-type DNA-binding
MKLHALLERLEQDGLAHIVSWQLHGRCFCIHKPKEFTEMILPTYLRQAKLTSFQRQLNLYGFQRLTRGKDTGGYYHELFLRGKGNLTKRMKRTKIKGTKFKAASSPDQEPDFYSMVRRELHVFVHFHAFIVSILILLFFLPASCDCIASCERRVFS